MNPRRLLCFYGDDFTGSTDALEALAANGVPSVLFLALPDEADLARFAECRAIGVAGESRSRGPEWMSRHLPRIFGELRRYGAPICQYKVCSTFDSSPLCGSIGRALEIGQSVFETPWVPIVVAAPHLGRFVVFGNLFAADQGAVHRIDRHPTMRHHPVTPMEEADLRLHLARQTARTVALLDLAALSSGRAGEELDGLLAKHPDAVLFDGLDERSMAETGRLLWTTRPPAAQTFAVGSAGLTHALIQHWRETGVIPREHTPETPAPADRLIAISGSCSPVTARQIRWAVGNGYQGIRIHPAATDGEAIPAAALEALGAGRGVILYTAMGPDDRSAGAGGEALGRTLGRVLRELLERSGVRRAVVAGGDTATHAVPQLGIRALTFAGLTAPGAPLCRCHAERAPAAGLELVLKGGQVGPEDFFELVRRGASRES